jgi:hypothetical protein
MQGIILANKIITVPGNSGGLDSHNMKGVVLKETIHPDQVEMLCDLGNGPEPCALFQDPTSYELQMPTGAGTPKWAVAYDDSVIERTASDLLKNAGRQDLKAGALVGIFMRAAATPDGVAAATGASHNIILRFVSTHQAVYVISSSTPPQFVHEWHAMEIEDADVNTTPAGAGVPSFIMKEGHVQNVPDILDMAAGAKKVTIGAIGIWAMSSLGAMVTAKTPKVALYVDWLIKPLSNKDEKFHYDPARARSYLFK